MPCLIVKKIRFLALKSVDGHGFIVVTVILATMIIVAFICSPAYKIVQKNDNVVGRVAWV